MKNCKSVQLPIVEPVYGTYHFQGGASAVIHDNPSLRNWFLNEVMNLCCSRMVLFGLTTPQIGIDKSTWEDVPFYDKRWYSTQFLRGCTNSVIRELLDSLYYVYFSGFDDYYMKGKTWYKERHFCHDGLICGYDSSDKTFTVFAYDNRWVYRCFKVPQKCFDAGRKSMYNQGVYGAVCGIKPYSNQVELDHSRIYLNLSEYLDSSLEKYPPDEKGAVYGITVQDYIVMYLDRLCKDEIPHNRMDRRVLRQIWEHKAVMLERIGKVEKMLSLGSDTSKAYSSLVEKANVTRMFYASYHMKRRDSLIPVMKNNLMEIRNEEEILLRSFVKKIGSALKI